MLATPRLGVRRDVFWDALMLTVTEGRTPSRTGDLGSESRMVIEAIAQRHPEANPDLIADAYDAFDRDAASANGTSAALRRTVDQLANGVQTSGDGRVKRMDGYPKSG